MSVSPRAAARLVVAVATVLRLAWAAFLPASVDCAYHCQYTVYPDLCYADHPPMTMLVAKAGITLFGGWVHPLSLRFGTVVLCAGTSWVVFRWTARWFGDRAGLWAVLGFSACHYFTAISGAWAVTDGPHFFFSALTGWLACEAVFPQSRLTPSPLGEGGRGEGDSGSGSERGITARVSSDSPSPLSPLPQGRGELRRWLLVGLAFGGALLSKYHGFLLPAGVVLYAAITPGARRLLWSPGPYLAVAIGLALFAPVVYWNATHEWASFGYQGGRIGDGQSPLVHGGPLIWLVGPILYLLPWMWFWLGGEFVGRAARFGRVTGVERLLVCLAAVPLVLFFIGSCLSAHALGHWPLVGFLPLLPLAGARWAGIRVRAPRWALAMAISWVAAELALVGGVLLQARTGLLPLPRWVDLGMKVSSGWDDMADELHRRFDLSEPGVFLATNFWEDAASLSFAVRFRVPVACYHSFDARGFGFWSKPADYVGRTGYMVFVDLPADSDPIREFGGYFARMTKAAEFPMLRGGTPFRTVTAFRCEQQTTPYPFEVAGRRK